MDKKEMFKKIHTMFMNGEKRIDIVKWIMEVKEVGKSQAYRYFDQYYKDATFMSDRDDLKEMVKKGIFAIYFNNVNRGYGRAACEALDRILVMFPWLKEKSEETQQADIKVIIQEWTDKNDKPE